MAQYYILLKKFFPLDSEPIFVGPYERRVNAFSDIEHAIEQAEYEIVTKKENEETQRPNNFEIAVVAEVMTATAAWRGGMSTDEIKGNLIGSHLPLTLDEMQFEYEKDIDDIKKDDVTLLADDVEENVEMFKIDQVYKLAEITHKGEISEALISYPYSINISNIEWLNQHGVNRQIRKMVGAEDIVGKSVVAILPYRIACAAKRVGIIDMPRIKADQRGKDIATSEMDDAGARLRWFRIIKEEGIWKDLFNFLDNKENWDKVVKLICQE